MKPTTAVRLSELPANKAYIATKQIEDNQKSLGVSYALFALCVFWLSGVHYFYLGKPIRGIVWLCTLGLLGLGNLYDLFMMRSYLKEYNESIEDEVVRSFCGDE